MNLTLNLAPLNATQKYAHIEKVTQHMPYEYTVRDTGFFSVGKP